MIFRLTKDLISPPLNGENNDSHLNTTIGCGPAEANSPRSAKPCGRGGSMIDITHATLLTTLQREGVMDARVTCKNSDTLPDGTKVPLSILEAATLPGSHAANSQSAWC
jgi:hypothetical protein